MRNKPNNNNQADDIINTHIVFSMGAGLVPIPGIDAIGVIAVQVDMIKQLADLYYIPFHKDAGKSYISAIIGGSMARLGASSLIKLIPGVGSIVGGVTMSAMSGASTYAIGQVFKTHFSTGGTMESFNLKNAKKIYEEQLKKGKKVAEDLARNAKTQEPKQNAPTGKKQESMDEVFEKLGKLSKLRDNKTISEADFQTQKTRLLNSI